MEMIGPLQTKVMHLLWRRGPMTVNQVHEVVNISPQGTPYAYTTILTVMRNLARRGFLKQDGSQKSHVFTPLVTREVYQQQLVAYVRDTLFEGDAEAMAGVLRAAPVAAPVQ